MEQIFNRISVIKLLKDGIKKGYWTLENLDKPSPQWKEVVDTCNGHPLYVKVIRVSSLKILLGLKNLNHLQLKKK